MAATDGLFEVIGRGEDVELWHLTFIISAEVRMELGESQARGHVRSLAPVPLFAPPRTTDDDVYGVF